MGIGTTVPDTTLHVQGGFKLEDGSQGAGKVLTSDADGLASWQNLAVGGHWVANGTAIHNGNPGAVGIGTSSPAASLLQLGTHFNGMPGGTGVFINGDDHFRFGAGDGDANYGLFLRGAWNPGTNRSVMIFGNRDVGVDTEILTLYDGKVGVSGPTSPAARLRGFSRTTGYPCRNIHQ